MACLHRLAPDERADLIEAHRHAAALKAIIDRVFANASPDLHDEMTWLVANVTDAASDLAGIVSNTEPMSFR
ncbi:hypothetical protein [Azospirillum tabaci]|uniref:hypothetical protein n=1 Tax=Azospirillum tabaci TaxID=2752310 RepID=UPI0016606B9F|nr:hypothetical protein [Azospirillum tabaci]